MGNASKLGASKEEYLNYHINRKEYGKVDEILTKYPDLLEKPITKDTKHNLLMRAVFSMNLNSVQYVLGKNANPNASTPKGETPLTIAIKKDKIDIVQRLIQAKADVNLINPTNGLKPIDLAILQGSLDIAKLLYSKMNPKQVKQVFEYEQIAKKYKYRYVNYKVFIHLVKSEEGVQHMAQNNYLKKQKPQLFDPVPDPRQSWGQWLKRNVDFKDAPMVERSSLPPELQPQNRKLGKLDIMIHNWVKIQNRKKVEYKPKQGRQVMSEMNDLIQRAQRRKQNNPDYQSAV